MSSLRERVDTVTGLSDGTKQRITNLGHDRANGTVIRKAKFYLL